MLLAQNLATQQGNDEPIRVSDLEKRAMLKGFRGAQVLSSCLPLQSYSAL